MFDLANGLVRIDMFPYPDDAPALGQERLIRKAISLDVSEELWPPVRVIDAWNTAVNRTKVPETPIDEHGNFPFREDYVGPNSHGGKTKHEVFAESIARTMKLGPNGDFRFGFRSFDSAHVSGSSR